VRAARELGIKVVRVVDYSPNSVAEFAVGLLLARNRKIPRAYNRLAFPTSEFGLCSCRILVHPL
jgi:lactate dehydrogenase-like 2-hydroxyacid dehydrogenase